MAVDHVGQLGGAFTTEGFTWRESFGWDGGLSSDRCVVRRGEDVGPLLVPRFILEDCDHVEVSVGSELQLFDDDDRVHLVG